MKNNYIYTVNSLLETYPELFSVLFENNLLTSDELFCTYFEYRDLIWDNLYAVGNYGDVISLPREYTDTMGRCRHNIGKALTPWNTKDGYLIVTLSWGNNVDGIRVKRNGMIHRLVAICFIENPNNYIEINHIDGNKHNNHFENLEWCTTQHNIRHAMRMHLSPVNMIPVKCKRGGDVWKQFECIHEAEQYYGIEDRYLNKAYHIKKSYQGVTVKDLDDTDEIYTESFEKLPSVPSKIPVRCIEDNFEFDTILDAAVHYGVSATYISSTIKNKDGYIQKIQKTFEFI